MIPLKYCLLGTLLLSASHTTFADSRFSCNTLQLQNAEPLIENMIDRILTIGKIRQQYNVCRLPNSSNAAAMIYQKKRVIAYDAAYLNQLAHQSGEMHWGKITVLAHEIGHHIHRHTDKLPALQKLPRMRQLALRRQYELQADQFAGKVLANMGASLSSTQALIRVLKLHQKVALSTHPDANKRVNAVTQGWNIGCRQAGSNCNSKIYKPNGRYKINQKNIQSPLGRNATAHYRRFMQQAETLKGARVNRNYCNLYASLAVNQTTRSQQYKCGFNVGSYGSPWNKAAAPQSNWCMKASAHATSKEAKFRETKLASCVARKQQRSKQQPTHSPLGRKATKNYDRFIQHSKKLKGQRVSRAYCNLYASVATYQTRRNNQHRCGFNLGDTANRWSPAFAPQSNWCMQVRSSITAGEATYREKKLSTCIR
jgi:hypothetical protein